MRSSSRQRLLPTDEQSLPPETTEAIQAFCAASPEVAAAYVCLVEHSNAGHDPQTALRLSFSLRDAVEEPGDSTLALRALLGHLVELQPAIARELGCGVLADRAVPAWEKHGIRVFAR